MRQGVYAHRLQELAVVAGAAQPVQQLLDQVVGRLGGWHRLGPLGWRRAEQVGMHPAGQRPQRAVGCSVDRAVGCIVNRAVNRTLSRAVSRPADRSTGYHLVEQLDRLGVGRWRRQPGHGQQQGLAPVGVECEQRTAAARTAQVAQARQVEHRPGALVLVAKAQQRVGGRHQQRHARR